jgi:general secretion pathway protein B
MSYILDALKKSEKERQRGTVPDILTIQEPISQKPKRRPILLYFLLAAILLNTGLLVWLLKTNSPEVKMATKEKSLKAINHFETQSTNATNTNQQNQTIQTKDNLQKKIQGNQKITIDTSGVHDIPPIITQQGDVPTEQKLISEAPLPDKIYDLNELPSSIQQSLPAFNISVSLYSDDPASRMAKINGQVMKEGQFLTAGLKLEEITKDGVIFSYQNYRFRVGLR